jgi:hypothetical protein
MATQTVNLIPPAAITNLNNALTPQVKTNSFTINSTTGMNSIYVWNVTSNSAVLTLQSGAANGSYVIVQDPNYTWNSQSTAPSVVFGGGATSSGIVTEGINASDLSSLVGSTIRFVYNSSTNAWNSSIIPATTDDPFHGWWRVITKGEQLGFLTYNQSVGTDPLPSGYTLPQNPQSPSDSFYNSYFYFDTISNYPLIKCTSYAGTLNETFEALKFEGLLERTVDDPNTIVPPGTQGTSSWTFENDLVYNSWWGDYVQITSFTLQSNGNQMISTINTDPDFIFQFPVQYNGSLLSTILEKMDAPPSNIRPYNDNEISFPDTQDPIYIFNYFATQLNERYNGGNNSIFGQDQWYPGYYNQKQIFQSYLDGKTIEYPIHHIVKSTTNQYQLTPNSQAIGSLTGATKIFLGNNHLVTKGSTISMTGFSGEWSVLNGTYNNDIIREGHWNYQSSGHYDLNSDLMTGSFYNVTNHFVMRLDTSSLTGISSGAYNGWAIYEGTPTVSVTHHITPNMNYNNFIAALRAYILEVYGSTEVSYTWAAFKNNRSGLIVEDWDNTSTQRATQFNSESIARSGISNTYTNPDEIGTDNYIYGDHYDVLNTLVTYITGAFDSGWSIPVLNYLDPDETYNLYYAFDGEFATGSENSAENILGQYQALACSDLGAMNVSIPGLTGGSIMVYTGAKYGGENDLDRTIWNIMYSANTVNSDEIYVYNYLIYGLIRSDLTDGKNIGYIFKRNPSNVGTANSFLNQAGVNAFTDPQIREVMPDKLYNGFIANYHVPIMKYFNSKKVDAVILDLRWLSSGEQYVGSLEQFFGGDRLNITKMFAYLNTKNQNSSALNIADFENYQNLFSTGADNYLHPSFLESAEGYGPGSVYRGSEQTGARVVFLKGTSSELDPHAMTWNMLGDNLDRNIGNNTKVKFLGNSKGYYTFNVAGSATFIPQPYIEESSRGLPVTRIGVLNIKPNQMIKLYTGASGAINYIAMNQINEYTAIDPMTSITGSFSNALGAPFPDGLEELIYPDFGFCENTRPRLPGDTRQQTPNPEISGTWRDAWLEASIAESVYGTW